MSQMIDEQKKVNGGGAKMFTMKETVKEYACNVTTNDKT
jgi:hypothetical protein